MIDLGNFSLLLATIVALVGAVVGLYAAKVHNVSLQRSVKNGVLVVGAASWVALFSLAHLFLTHQYQYSYVWRTSNNDMHWMYLISAVWGGMDGSMLLWAALTALYGMCLVLRSKKIPHDIMAWTVPVLLGATGFFLLVTALCTNPFRLHGATPVPGDGNGLNPLLQNPSMMIHPPCLYLGFTSFVIPFAFALGMVLRGNVSPVWTQLTRRWTLVGWAFLTAGIFLGGNWAYIELGWGGFWAWDPVENASFLPWLTATAYLHSVMVERHRGMLKLWNVTLAIATYLLTVFGTFLTRSGVVQSVHAFAESDIGWVFLLYIGIVTVVAIVGLVLRRAEFRPENRITSFLSREAIFLFNNLLLLGVCFATIWGVMFPVLSEAVTGTKQVVGPPFFNQVNVPLFMALMFFMGFGPLVAWRRSAPSSLLRTFTKPILAGCVITFLFLWLDSSRVFPAVSFGLCMFAAWAIGIELHRGVSARRAFTGDSYGTSALRVITGKSERYGGLLVHVGVVIVAIAITASMGYKVEKDVVLPVGGVTTIGAYKLKLDELKKEDFPNYQAIKAQLSVTRSDDPSKVVTVLHPERRWYQKNQEVTTEVDIRMTLRDDLYVALAGLDMPKETAGFKLDTASAVLKIFVNPLQFWLWVGAGMMLLGTALVLRPKWSLEAPATVPSEVRDGALA